jgi:sirohydrochlorin ferrochelatase
MNTTKVSSINTVTTATLLIAHGSRRAEYLDEVMCLADKLSTYIEQPVLVAFLSLVKPDINDQLLALRQKGITQIKVIPYFLAAGVHVANDIPEIIGNFLLEYPGIHIEITEHFGANDAVISALAKML